MKNLPFALGILCILLLLPITLPAQESTQLPAHEPSVSIPNAEPSHAHYTLADGREMLFTLNLAENNDTTYLHEFSFLPQWKGSQVFVRIPGPAIPFEFRINNFLLSSGTGTTSATEFNITPFLKDGTNSLEVIIEHTSVEAVWINSSEAAIIIREPVHIRDLQITSHPGKNASEIMVRVQLYIQSYLTNPDQGRSLAMFISDSTGNSIIIETRSFDIPVAFRQEMEITFDQIIENPMLWSPDHPNLYQVRLHLVEQGNLMGEMISTNFGINQDTLEIRIE